ncbi:transglutaminase-like cysteine peptidase [Castellaniella caeni]|uniref:transglutaminase-like cysteine peptidase n=1 Tax=Castellaniella caeni TaxID=266123 RepID=UPI003F775703
MALPALVGLCLVLVAVPAPAPAFAFDPSALQAYARKHYGARAERAVLAWQAMLAQAKGLSEQEKLRAVNDFWNSALIGGEDITIWHTVDYWATPVESLSKGAGDCEDYVIGKYFSLIDLGVPPEKLRLVYVRAQVGNQSIAHMVLGYYPSPQAEPLVLDSLVDRIQLAHLRPDLTPVFSFNARGIYMPGGARRSVDQIGRWRDLLRKMRAEGFQP